MPKTYWGISKKENSPGEVRDASPTDADVSWDGG